MKKSPEGALSLSSIKAKKLSKQLKRHTTKKKTVTATRSSIFDDSTSVSSPHSFDSVPVTGFGAHLLQIMGQKPGRAIGKRDEPEIISKEADARPWGAGLGAEAAVSGLRKGSPLSQKSQPRRKKTQQQHASEAAAPGFSRNATLK